MDPNEQRSKKPGRTITIQLNVTSGFVVVFTIAALLLLLLSFALLFFGSNIPPAVADSPPAPVAVSKDLGDTPSVAPGGSPLLEATTLASLAPSSPLIAAKTYPDPASGMEPLVASAVPLLISTAAPPPPIFNPVRPTELVEATAAPAPSITPSPPDFVMLQEPAAVLLTADVAQATRGLQEVASTVAPPQPAIASELPEKRQLDIDIPPSPTIEPPTIVALPVVPVDAISGVVHWGLNESPIVLRRNVQILPGATLLVDPGVVVLLDAGVAIVVEERGTFETRGLPGQRIQMISVGSQRWDGIYAKGGSLVSLSFTDVRNGGAGGTLLAVEGEGSRLVLNNAQITQNFGHIQVADTSLAITGSVIAQNTMPYGAAIQAAYSGDNLAVITDNRMYDNLLTQGAATLQIANQRGSALLRLDIQRNLLASREGPNVEIFANGLIHGGLTCNSLAGGTNGLSVHSEFPESARMQLNVRDNAIEAHTPPIIPFYVEHGIGRGATSEIVLGMGANWWSNESGPYEPERHADGRGEAVGVNIAFEPWLTARPTCAPIQ